MLYFFPQGQWYQKKKLYCCDNPFLTQFNSSAFGEENTTVWFASCAEFIPRKKCRFEINIAHVNWRAARSSNPLSIDMWVKPTICQKMSFFDTILPTGAVMGMIQLSVYWNPIPSFKRQNTHSAQTHLLWSIDYYGRVFMPSNKNIFVGNMRYRKVLFELCKNPISYFCLGPISLAHSWLPLL